MSNSLQRLRTALGDMPFERIASGVRPTSRGLELWQQLQPHYLSIEKVLTPEAFDPMAYGGAFTIAMPLDGVIGQPLYDSVLAAHGIRRNLIITLNHYTQTLAVLAATDYIAVLPVSLLDLSAYAARLCQRDRPADRDARTATRHDLASAPREQSAARVAATGIERTVRNPETVIVSKASHAIRRPPDGSRRSQL